MSILTDGSIASIVYGATSDLLMRDLTLRQQAAGQDADGNPNGIMTAYTMRGMVDQFSSFRKAQLGIPDTDAKILLLQSGAPATPQAGDELAIDGVRYLVQSVAKDPAGATWEIHGVLIG